MSDATRFFVNADGQMEPDQDGSWVDYDDHLAALERVRVEALRETRAAVSGLLDAYRDRSGAYSSSERIYHGEMRATARRSHVPRPPHRRRDDGAQVHL